MRYSHHYHNLEKLTPVIDKMKAKEPVFISYIGNSNCATLKEEGYSRIWPEILTPELKCYFQTLHVYGTVLGLPGQRWSEVLKQRAALLDHLPADLFVVYCGMRINFAKDYDEYVSDLEEVLSICTKKTNVMAVTSMPMIALDVENRRALNKIWECDEHLEKHAATRALILKKFKLPCVDLYSIWKDMHEADDVESTDLFEHSDTAHPGILGQFMVARIVRKAFFSSYESIFFSGGGR